MKLKLPLGLVLMLFLLSGNLNAINPISPEASAESVFSVGDFLDMDYKQFKTMTGKKWVLGDRLKHRAMKKYIQFEVNRNKVETSEDFSQAAGGFNFKWAAFFLGFFLNIFGIIFVILFYDKPRKSALLSWLIGFLIGGGVGFGFFLR